MSALARFTPRLFGLWPASLTLLALRLTLALPFFRSGLTKWDGASLSFGASALFNDEYKLHWLGAEYPLPYPDQLALTAALAEIALPILLALGLATRYAALGLLVMVAVIQLVYPEGWQTYHLPWAAMALALASFGAGRLSLDARLGLDKATP